MGEKLINKEDVKNFSVIEKFILMLLYAAGGKIKGKLWFQKEIFELSKVFKELAEELDFNAYSYGPFSESLDEHLDMLINSGFVAIQNCEKAQPIKLTEKGLEVAKIIWDKEPINEKKVIEATTEFLESLDKDELILYVYAISPKMAEQSDIKENVYQRRIEIALRMLEEGKISLSLAAKLAGLSVNDMMQKAIKRGIKLFDVQDDLGN